MQDEIGNTLMVLKRNLPMGLGLAPYLQRLELLISEELSDMNMRLEQSKRNVKELTGSSDNLRAEIARELADPEARR